MGRYENDDGEEEEEQEYEDVVKSTKTNIKISPAWPVDPTTLSSGTRLDNIHKM